MADPIRLWDGPTRLFHWLLAASVLAALITGWLGGSWINWHGLLGLFIVGLLAFRLAWGVLGSTYVRFSTVLGAPLRMGDYLRGTWTGAGHNPLGSLSVLAMLAVLIFQAVSGLFSNDDIAFNGPLYALIGSDLSARISSWHRLGMWAVTALIAVHLLAIIFYARFKKQPLVQAMITGRTQRQHPEQRSASGGGWFALVIALVLAGLVAWGASGAWIAPPAPVAAPAW